MILYIATFVGGATIIGLCTAGLVVVQYHTMASYEQTILGVEHCQRSMQPFHLVPSFEMLQQISAFVSLLPISVELPLSYFPPYTVSIYNYRE